MYVFFLFYKMASCKRCVLIVCSFILIMLVIDFGRNDSGENDSITENNIEQSHKQRTPNSVKTIQWYDTFHNNNGLRCKSGNVDFRKCNYKSCKFLDYFEATNDSSGQHGPLDADAVVFQGNHLGDMTPPLRRDNDQVFVFAERETWWHLGLFHSMLAPQKPYKTVKEAELGWFSRTMPSFLISPQTYMNSLKFRNIFNWTMTYRLDSDIQMLYGQILHKKNVSTVLKYKLEEENRERHYDIIYKRKKRDVVWLVSHCATKSRREKYVEKLKQYINVDIFGKCGQDFCPKKTVQSGCLEDIISKYKFVLSFENTFHKDYVTEKLFDWFPRNIVPVVYGMADYKRIAPEGTVINAADFSSPKLLANFLHYVGSNRDVYIKYLRRKKRYISIGHDEMQQRAYCKLCDWLHNLNGHRQFYPKIDKWWQLNDTSGYIKLFRQAMPSSGNKQKYWVWFSLSAVIIFFLCYIVRYIYKILTKAVRKIKKKKLSYRFVYFSNR